MTEITNGEEEDPDDNKDDADLGKLGTTATDYSDITELADDDELRSSQTTPSKQRVTGIHQIKFV